MNLEALLHAVIESDNIKPNRIGPLKSSALVLARATGKNSLSSCNLSDYHTADWKKKLNSYLTSESYASHYSKPARSSTVRNHRNNLSYLFRQAYKLDLLQELNKSLDKMYKTQSEAISDYRAQSPYKEFYYNSGSKYKIDLSEFPQSIKDEWTKYEISKSLIWRDYTKQRNRKIFERYIGFLINIKQLRNITIDCCINKDNIHLYILWLAEFSNQRITKSGEGVLKTIISFAKFLNHTDLSILKEYNSTLPSITPVHDDRFHDISLQEIHQVANALLQDGRRAISTPSDRRDIRFGLNRSLTFQAGLILKTLANIPMRQRQIREMKIDKNLYWKGNDLILKYKGEELKVSHKNGRVNTLEHNLSIECPEIVPLYQEFLSLHRPKILGDCKIDNVFVTKFLRPFSEVSLHEALAIRFFQHTGKRFYPHRIRHIWASEYISQTQDYEGAAEALGDNLNTVFQRYYYLKKEPVKQRLSAFRQQFSDITQD